MPSDVSRFQILPESDSKPLSNAAHPGNQAKPDINSVTTMPPSIESWAGPTKPVFTGGPEASASWTCGIIGAKPKDSLTGATDPIAGNSSETNTAIENKPTEAEKNPSESFTDSLTLSKVLEVGDVLPGISLPNQSGEIIELGPLAKEKGIVIFIVPKAHTPGRTTWACGFRDNYQDFTTLDYAVYCLSHDSPEVQATWQNKHTLPYPLLSDPKRTFIGLLGASAGYNSKRSHFVFEKGTGKLVEKQMGVKPAQSPESVLKFVKKHAASN